MNEKKPTQEEMWREYQSLCSGQRAEEYSSTVHAAQRIGISRRTLQWWVAMGYVPAIRQGRRILIRYRSLLDYLERRGRDTAL